MEQTSTDRPGTLKRAFNDPLRGWLWMGAFFALIGWAATAWRGAWEVPILAALLGIGTQQALVYIRDESERTLPLRLWEGTLSMLWFGAWMELLVLGDDPFSFLLYTFTGGAAFAALTISTKKPYGAGWEFLDLEERTVFQHGGLPARLAAAWPFLTLALALITLWATASPLASVLTIAVLLTLTPRYRRPKPRPGSRAWEAARLLTTAVLTAIAFYALLTP